VWGEERRDGGRRVLVGERTVELRRAAEC